MRRQPLHLQHFAQRDEMISRFEAEMNKGQDYCQVHIREINDPSRFWFISLANSNVTIKQLK